MCQNANRESGASRKRIVEMRRVMTRRWMSKPSAWVRHAGSRPTLSGSLCRVGGNRGADALASETTCARVAHTTLEQKESGKNWRHTRCPHSELRDYCTFGDSQARSIAGKTSTEDDLRPFPNPAASTVVDCCERRP